ncbi:MAG: glycosyltransferase [Nitrospirae bacterium]|nr:glycosyltransferase [Nitrospirota bacterium]
MIKFVIFSHPRSGSNYLCSLLDSHPEILCHFELFHPDKAYYSLAFNDEEMLPYPLERRDNNTGEFINKVFKNNMGRRAVGFKIFIWQSDEAHDILLNDRTVLKIMLSRRNVVQAFVSEKIAEKTGIFTQPIYEPELQGPQVKVNINVNDLMIFDNDIRNYFINIKKNLDDSGQRYLELYFEDLFNQVTVDSIFSFLGIEKGEHKLSSYTTKQNPKHLKEKVENLETLKQELKGTHLGIFLDETAYRRHQREERIKALKKEIRMMNEAIGQKNDKISFLKEKIKIMNEDITILSKEWFAEKLGFEEESCSRERRLNDLLGSKSWKLTLPMRFLLDNYHNSSGRINSFASKVEYLTDDLTRSIRNPVYSLKTLARKVTLSLSHQRPKDISILVIDRDLPRYDMDSGGLRMYSILKILRNLGYSVTFLPDDLKAVEPCRTEFQNFGIKVLCGDIDVEKYLADNGPSLTHVVMSRPEQAYKFISLVRAYAINSTVIYDTVDLHWLRFERASTFSDSNEMLDKAAHYKKLELLCASCADIVLTVTEDDKKFLLIEDPRLRTEVLPNIHETVKNVTPFRKRKNLMFIGGFYHRPNVDAMLFFVREILPIIKQEIPDTKLFIVGSNPPKEILELKSGDVEVTGYVRDVSPYFENCRVFVSPLRYGAGMKGKIGHSMGYGLPVVTTTIGAEGIGLTNFRNALISDEPKEFAEFAIRLYKDKELWNRISRNSILHIKENYSPIVIENIVSRIFEVNDK